MDRWRLRVRRRCSLPLPFMVPVVTVGQGHGAASQQCDCGERAQSGEIHIRLLNLISPG